MPGDKPGDGGDGNRDVVRPPRPALVKRRPSIEGPIGLSRGPALRRAQPEPPRPESRRPPPPAPARQDATQSRTPDPSAAKPPPPPDRKARSIPPPPQAEPPRQREAGPSKGAVPPPPPRRSHEPVLPAPPERREAPWLERPHSAVRTPKPGAGEARVRATRELLRRYLAELETEPKPAQAARLNYECARLLEYPLGEKERAREHYEKALSLMPTHIPSLQGARRTQSAGDRLQSSEARAEVLRLLDQEFAGATDAQHQVALLSEKGRILSSLGRHAEAQAAFTQGLLLSPRDMAVRKRALYEARLAKDRSALQALYRDAPAGVTGDTGLRSALLAEGARFAEFEEQDPAQATELYHHAFAEDPRSLSALDALKRLLYAEKRWGDLGQVLEREARQSAHPRVRALAYYRMGRLAHDVLGDHDAALKAFEAARKEAPDEALVLTELARLYERVDRNEELVDVLQHLADLEGLSTSRVVIFHRIGQLCDERLGASERAMQWLEKALALDPTFAPALQALSALCVRHEGWQRLVDMHLAEAARTADKARAAAAHQRAAEVFELRLGNVERAIEHHAKALAVLPGHLASQKALSRLYTQEGKPRELIELCERAIEWSDEIEAKVALLFRIGRVYEDLLGNCASAVAAYRRILELVPGHLGGLHAWQRAAERGGMWTELVTALRAEVEAARGKRERLVLLQRVGEVIEREIGDPEAALSCYEEAQKLDPSATPVLSDLGRLYHRLGRFQDLVRTHEVELTHLSDPEARARLFLKLGELYELRLGEEAAAIRCYRSAIDENPALEPARTALEALYRSGGQWQALVELLEAHRGKADAKARAEILFRAGEIHEHRLGQLDRALFDYEQAANADPGFRPAQDAKIRLLSEGREWKRLIQELEREAQDATDPVLQAAARLREAELLRDELGDGARATLCFEQALALDPQSVPALLALETLYLQAGSAQHSLEKLAGVLERQATVFVDPGARIAALRRAAELPGAGLEERKARYLSILQLAPDDFDALKGLESIGLELGDGELLAQLDAALSAAARHPALASAHLTRLAEALEFENPADAGRFYREALERDVHNWAATFGLARLAQKSGNREALIEAAERLERVAADSRTASELLVLAFDAEPALDTGPALLERALEVHPDSIVAATKLRDALGARGDIDRLLDTLTRAAQRATSPEALATLWGYVSGIHAELRRDPGAAIAALLRARERSPGNVPLLLTLAELYARNDQWTDAAEQWSQVLAVTTDKPLLVATHVRLAAAADHHLGQTKRAFKHLDSALRLAPDHQEALTLLLGLQRKEGLGDGAEITAEHLVQGAEAASDKARALVLLGEVRREHGRQEAALEAYEQAIVIGGVRGGDLGALRSLIEQQRPLEKTESYRRLADALSRHTRNAQGEGVHFVELARVLGDGLGHEEEALQALQAGIAACPNDPALPAELAARLRLGGRLGEAAQALRQVIRLDFMNEQAWRDLGDAYRGLEKNAERLLALSALDALDCANDVERAELAARPLRPYLRRASLDLSTLQGLGVTGLETAAAGVLVAISDSLPRLHPPDLARYRVAADGRLGARSPNPLRAVGDYLASVLDLGDYELYVHRRDDHGVYADFADPVALIVPEATLELAETHQMLVLARAMINVVRRVHAVDRFSLDELELLIAGVARQAAPDFGAGRFPEAELRRYSRQIHKALPWLGKGAVEEAAARFVSEVPIDIADFALGLERSALRLAVVLTDALRPACEILAEDPQLLGLPKETNLEDAIADLLQFWVSDAALRMRHRLGTL